MIVLIFSIVFLLVFLLTRSYRYLGQYYATIHFVSCLSLFYALLCRGYLLWTYPSWWILTPKLCAILQFGILFPCSTVLYLRYRPHHKWNRLAFFVGFVAIYAFMEWLMFLRKEIIYQYGWNFCWSVLIDCLMFLLIPVHQRNWKVALPIAGLIIVTLVVWFRVPMTG